MPNTREPKATTPTEAEPMNKTTVAGSIDHEPEKKKPRFDGMDLKVMRTSKF